MSIKTFLFGEPKPKTFRGYIHVGPVVDSVRRDPFPPSPRIGLFEKISVLWNRLCAHVANRLPGAKARQAREAEEFVAYTLGRIDEFSSLCAEPASPELSRAIERF